MYYSNTIDDLNPKDFQEITIAELGLSIYASKKNYALVKEKLIILCCLSFFLSSIFCYLSYFLFRKLQNLEKRLQEKSKELLNSRELFRINSELLSSVLESPQNIVMFSLDRFYNYIAFNENYRRLVGNLHGIPIRKGMNVFDIVPKKNRALSIVNYNRALNGESFDFIQ